MEEEGHHSQQLKVLSIVGFGGLGKTTLANQVYSEIKNEFECTAFVTVSRTPHIPKILKDILFRVGYGGMEMEDDVQKLVEILRARLTNKRHVLYVIYGNIFISGLLCFLFPIDCPKYLHFSII
jgi:predicted ATPase